jgi:hypothetical protein
MTARIAYIASATVLATVASVVVNIVTSGGAWWLWPILAVSVAAAIVVEIWRERSTGGLPPISAATENLLEQQRARCEAEGRRFFTPDLLLALLTPAGDIAALFDESGINSGALADQLSRYTRALSPAEAGPYEPFRWTERPDIRRAQDTARRAGAPAVTGVHVLLGVLATPSRTRELLTDRYAMEVRRLRATAKARARRPPAAAATPGVIWPRDS